MVLCRSVNYFYMQKVQSLKTTGSTRSIKKIYRKDTQEIKKSESIPVLSTQHMD